MKTTFTMLAAAALLSLFVLIMASCAPVPSAPAVQESPLVIPTSTDTPLFTEAQREDACLTYMDVDLKEAYRRFHEPIFWTYHLNFLEGDDENTWLGCLRYYWRDNSNTTFTGTLDTAVVVMCHSEPTSTTRIHTVPIADSESIPDSSGKNRTSVPKRKALFEGDAYVVCPFDIAGSLATLARTDTLTNSIESVLNAAFETDAAEALTAVPQLAASTELTYGEFMLAAGVASIASGSGPEHPLVYYTPVDEAHTSAATGSGLHVGLSVTGDTDVAEPVYSFAGTLASTDYEPVDLAQPPSAPPVPEPQQSCLVVHGEKGFYAWADFGQLPAGQGDEQCQSGESQYFQFISQGIIGNQEPVRCGNRNVAPMPPPPAIPFWVGPSTVYVGHNPATGSTFQGEMYEVWVDPDSAIKPTRFRSDQ